MRRGTPGTKTVLVLVTGIFVSVTFDVLIWHHILTNHMSMHVSIGVPTAQASIVVPRRIKTPDSESVAVEQESIGVPVRISIPSIDVDAAIEEVALTADESMDVPKNPLDAGWYGLGIRPGETGSAVIDGHVDWVNGASAVFADLREVSPGDKIIVQDDKGAAVSFVVRESHKYGAESDATDIFVSTDGKAHLNLITCHGAWDKRAKQYSERLVVFADKE